VKTIAIVIALVLVLGGIGVTVYVEVPAGYKHEVLSSNGKAKAKAKALVLYHPSRDAHFSDELSLAVAEGLKVAGLSVDRATLSGDTPAMPQDYALLAVVSNTFWFTPDLPTLRFLSRARLQGMPAIGLIGGAGSTDRSQTMLDDALRKAGAKVLRTRAFWIAQPNDDKRMSEPNRQVALDMAKQFGAESGRAVLEPHKP
jgi:hypothetical protein